MASKPQIENNIKSLESLRESRTTSWIWQALVKEQAGGGFDGKERREHGSRVHNAVFLIREILNQDDLRPQLVALVREALSRRE